MNIYVCNIYIVCALYALYMQSTQCVWCALNSRRWHGRNIFYFHFLLWNHKWILNWNSLLEVAHGMRQVLEYNCKAKIRTYVIRTQKTPSNEIVFLETSIWFGYSTKNQIELIDSTLHWHGRNSRLSSLFPFHPKVMRYNNRCVAVPSKNEQKIKQIKKKKTFIVFLNDIDVHRTKKRSSSVIVLLSFLDSTCFIIWSWSRERQPRPKIVSLRETKSDDFKWKKITKKWKLHELSKQQWWCPVLNQCWQFFFSIIMEVGICVIKSFYNKFADFFRWSIKFKMPKSFAMSCWPKFGTNLINLIRL